MIAALYSSRQQGTKEFTKDNQEFGWKTVEAVFAQEMERVENGLSRKVPGLICFCLPGKLGPFKCTACQNNAGIA